MKTWKTLKTVTFGMMVVFGTVFVMGNTAPTCVPLEPEMEVVCLSASECAALTPDVDCIGEWACENGDCVFHCDEDPEPPVSECEWDGDCAPNQHCEIVDCWAPPCEEGEPCMPCCMPIGECIDDEPGECFDDSDCPDGFYCEPLVWFTEEVPGDPKGEEPFYAPIGMGQCMPLPQPGCLEDADCGPGFVCELIDECIPLPCEDEEGVPLPCDWNYEFDGDIDCAPYGVCVPEAEPKETCYSSEECAPGQICSVELGDCLPFPGCDEDMNCPTVCLGVCLDMPEPECFDDEDCPEGFICEYVDGPYPCECDPDDDFCLMYDCMPLGQCVPAPQPGECESDADCGPYQVCEFIDCLDYDCGEDEYCGGVDCAPFGICIDVPVPPLPECFSDEDCDAGEVCDLMEGPYPCECDPDDEYCLMIGCMPLGVCVEAPEPLECNPTGCSGQLCAPFDINTTCEWVPHYACFKDANCGHFGPNGGCAWEHTPELSACLAQTL